MVSRFFCPGPLVADSRHALPEAVAHHAQRVLRLRDGEEVVLFDGSGNEYPGRLEYAGRAAFAQLEAASCPERESPLRIVLVQALASGDKMDLVVQKAVELGAVAIQPIEAERSVLKLAGERADKRVQRWQQVAVSACEQCGRNLVPQVRPVQRLGAYLKDSGALRRIVLAPGGARGLAGIAAPTGEIHLLVGPEGGWSAAELAACLDAGCEALSLGPRVLRTETAGLAALAALQARWGDFS